MNNIVTFVCDLHIGSPIQIMEDQYMNVQSDENTFFLGDIIDLANCKKSEIKKYQDVYLQLKRKHGENIIPGNHERSGISEHVIKRPNFVAVHGDLQANLKRWTEYRSKPHGAGFLKRTFLVPFIREAEMIVERKPKSDFLDRAADFSLAFGMNTYICGHFHPKNKIEIMHKGVRIIILPRGITKLDLSQDIEKEDKK
jgi:UDP-2,3-diacylglucosamine pyrophosphatase LpxH